MTVALDPNDTIAAIASPPGPGFGASSGSRARRRSRSLLAELHPAKPRLCRLVLARLSSGSMRVDGLRPLLPVMLALWPAPRTYTGQDLAEIHLVGAIPLVNLVLAHCLARGARHAEPGEFTLRAFLSGRIDLTRAEAVLGVIEASNPAQLDAALEQLAGGLSGPIVATARSFARRGGTSRSQPGFHRRARRRSPGPGGPGGRARTRQAPSSTTLARRLGDRDRAEGHPRVVLVGPPNVGKSRLFNALLGEDRAIVSPQAGTTRDYLSALCDCDGLTVELVDTAGIEEAGDTITRRRRPCAPFRPSAPTCCSFAARPKWLRSGMRLSPRPDRRRLAGLDQKRSDRCRLLAAAARRSDRDECGHGDGSATTLRSAIARRFGAKQAEDNLPAGTAARCRGSLRWPSRRLGKRAESPRERRRRRAGRLRPAIGRRRAGQGRRRRGHRRHPRPDLSTILHRKMIPGPKCELRCMPMRRAARRYLTSIQSFAGRSD